MHKPSPAKLVAVLAVTGLMAGSSLVEANPFTRFLYTVRHPRHRHAMSHWQHRPDPAAPSPSPPAVAAQVASDTPKRGIGARQIPTRATSRFSAVRKEPSGLLPNGILVADKPGFVKSPYPPGDAVIDVRGFPKGTRVQDPFTGKTFITP